MRRFLADHKLGVAVATAALVVVVGGVAVASDPEDAATVTAIVDGDTIDVDIDGEEHRVRLLNIDTPETGECLAEEATAFLEQRIPPGTVVDLEYDKERHDQYGRVLAGVVEDGSLVNAEIARNGLGVAVLFEPNRRFYDDVAEAQQAAEEEGLGLWSEAIGCTLPGQLREYGKAVTELEGRIGRGTLTQIDGWAAQAAALVATGIALAELLDGDDSAFPLLAYAGPRWTFGDTLEEYAGRVDDAQEQIETARIAAEERIAERERREQVERERKEREEAERIEREEREREEAERREREEAERQAAEEARAREAAEAERRAAERAEQERRQSSSGSSSAGSSSSGGGSGGGGGSVYYQNCAAARAAGAAPVYAGQPGYGTHLDRDRDGIGCE